MATGYAKATGKIGVCLATSGPGGIHLLNGLYDAKLDHMPVLAITGMQETSVLGTGYQQEVGLDKLYADVAEYNQMIYNPAQLPGVVDIAIRTAYARRGVAHIDGAQRYSGRRRRRRPLAARGPGPPAADRAGHAPGPGTAAGRGPAAHRRAAGRDQLPVHQAPARGGQGQGGPDRGRPGPGRRPDRHRAARRGRRQGGPGGLLPMLTCDGGTIATWAARHWARSCGSRWCSATRSTVSAIRSRS